MKLIDRLPEKTRRLIGTWGLTVILAGILGLVALGLLWVDQWWSAGWLSDLVDRVTGRSG